MRPFVELNATELERLRAEPVVHQNGEQLGDAVAQDLAKVPGDVDAVVIASPAQPDTERLDAES